MTQTINRLYETPQTAAAAVAELKANGFADEHTFLIGYSGGHPTEKNEPEPPTASLIASIAAAKVLRAHAVILADGVARGGSLVVVHAEFGRAAAAIEILDSFGPIDSGVPDPIDILTPYDDQLPFSSAFRMPLLSKDPTPFSTFWNVAVLISNEASLSRALDIPLLVTKARSISASFNVPELIDSNATASSLLNMPLLKRDRARR